MIAHRVGSLTGLVRWIIDLRQELRPHAARPIQMIMLTGAPSRVAAAAAKMFGWTAAEVIGKALPTVQQEAPAESERSRQRLLATEAFIQPGARRRRRDGRPIDIGVSIGIAVYPHDAADPDALLNKADAAMYSARTCGNCLQFFAT